MMSNPAVMQQSMAMAQQMFGRGAASPAFGEPFGGSDATPAPGASQMSPMPPAMLAAQRVRLASQLTQLVAMGFTNETLCLQVLVQHNGRVDAAIDTLLSS